jgi:hypothetical protein
LTLRPRQPRARRGEHPLVPCGLEVLLLPRREAPHDALVADAPDRLLREVLDALLLLLLLLQCDHLLRRAGQRDLLHLELPLELLLPGLLHEGDLGLRLGLQRHHLLLRRAKLALRIALHLLRHLPPPVSLPAALPVAHRCRQRRPHQPRARRREHSLVPCRSKVLL